MSSDRARATLEIGGLGADSPSVGPIELPDPRLSVYVGEMIYNLRSALDYLVFAVAWRDSKRIQDGTQFPIERDPKVFKSRVTGRLRNRRCKQYLRGVEKAHVDWIERYQPYKGCLWTQTLADWSNPDKHRQLLSLQGVLTVRTQQLGPVRLEAETGRQFVDVENWIDFGLLANGEPLEQQLGILQQEVGNVLALFDPIF